MTSLITVWRSRWCCWLARAGARSEMARLRLSGLVSLVMLVAGPVVDGYMGGLYMSSEGGKKGPRRGIRFNKAPRPPPNRIPEEDNSFKAPTRDLKGERGPSRADPGQHLTPDHLMPKFDYDIEGRPNQRKSRKAAAAAEDEFAKWQKPSRIEVRREKKREREAMEAQVARMKARHQKVQRFANDELVGTSTLSTDVLRCEHFGKCSGCFFNAGLTETPLMEDARLFFRTRARVENMTMTMGPVHEWRTQAKLAVAPLSKWGGCVIGLYEEGSHRVAPIPRCRVHHPSINKAVAVVQKATEQLKVRAYDESDGTGELRYIQCVVERRTGKVQLTLVWNAIGRKAASAELPRFVKHLRDQDPSGTLWHSIWVNFRTGPGNAILSREPRAWYKTWGSDFLTEKVGPSQVVLYFTPMLFRQGNLDGFQAIIERIQGFVPSQSTVCELYGGVGVIGLNLLGKVKELRLSDINPFLPMSVDKIVAQLSEKRQEKLYFTVATAWEAIEDGQCVGADVLIVDPPRKGLEPEVLQSLCDRKQSLTNSVKRLIYVSCGFEALKRDADALLNNGWSVTYVEGFVLFPGTDHLETLAIFDRH